MKRAEKATAERFVDWSLNEEQTMVARVSEVMTRGVRTMSPNDSVLFAAQAMDELNVGVMPVCDGDNLVGVVTDRDITVRSVARDLPPKTTTLRDVMSPDVQWCFEDQSVDEVARQMRDAQIRRMPVVDHDKHLVGMLSLGDVAAKGGPAQASDALAGISEPAGPDRSGAGQASGSGPAPGSPRKSP